MTATLTDRALCGANKRQGEGTCTLPAGWGTEHPGVGPCRKHLGNTGNHVKAAAKAMMARTLAEVAPAPIGDPIERMAEVVSQYDAFHRMLWAKIGEARVDGSDVDLLSPSMAPYVAEAKAAAQTMQRFLADWVRLGMEERMVSLDERRAELVVFVLRSALGSLGLPPDVLERAEAAVGAKLLELSEAA